MLSPLARLCRAQLHPETGWQLTAEELPHVSHIQHWPLENRPIGLRPGYHKQIRYIIDAVRKVPPIPHTSTSCIAIRIIKGGPHGLQALGRRTVGGRQGVHVPVNIRVQPDLIERVRGSEDLSL